MTHVFFLQDSSPLWFYRTSQLLHEGHNARTRVKVNPEAVSFLYFFEYILSLLRKKEKKNRSTKDGSRTHRRFSKQSNVPSYQLRSTTGRASRFAPFAQSFCLLIPNTPPLVSPSSPRFLLANFISLQLRFVEPSLPLSLSLSSFLIPRRESWFTIYDQRKSKNTWKLNLQVSGYVSINFQWIKIFNIQKVKPINLLLLLLLKSKYSRNDWLLREYNI